MCDLWQVLVRNSWWVLVHNSWWVLVRNSWWVLVHNLWPVAAGGWAAVAVRLLGLEVAVTVLLTGLILGAAAGLGACAVEAVVEEA
jgi:hypothetical protein